MNLRQKIAAGFVLAQVVFFAGWAAYEESRLLPGAGESIVVKPNPIDPRDLLSGQYLNLSYPFGNVKMDLLAGDRPEEGDAVWVTLRETQGLWEAVSMSKSRPKGPRKTDVVIRGRCDRWEHVAFGIERFFVPEGTETPRGSGLTVRLRVGDDHEPRIEGLYLNGKPWPH